MKPVTFVAVLGLFAVAVPRASAAGDTQGDAAAGETKAIVCAACHGMDGNSVNPVWPSLAGQHENYTIAQLNAFKNNERLSVLMNAQAVGLSDQDMADLAAYYTGLPAKPMPADAKLVDEGKRLYRIGDADKGVAACAACHGPAGRGNGPGNIPAVAGQRDSYLIMQLKAYADGSRKASSVAKTSMMQTVSSKLDDEQMKALATYVQGLN